MTPIEFLNNNTFTVYTCQKSEFAVIYKTIQELAQTHTLFLTHTDTSLLVQPSLCLNEWIRAAWGIQWMHG